MTLEEENKMLKEKLKIAMKRIKEMGKMIPTYNERGAGRKSNKPGIRDKVVELKDSGFTYAEIAKKTEISKSYVGKILKEEGR